MLAHTLAGGLGGGLGGAVGAGSSAIAAQTISKIVDGMDLPDAVKQAVGAATAAVVGPVGGAAGVAEAVNVDINNRQLHIANYDRLRDGCRGSSSTECQTINRMAGVRSGMPTDDPFIPASKVVANYDSNNIIVSYTIVDRSTNQPTMIMEPLEYAAYRNAPAGTQALMELSPQYALDFASAGLYASAGSNGRAIEHVIAGVTSRDYVRDVALGIAGAAVSAAGSVKLGVNGAGANSAGLGKTLGQYSAVEPGPLADNLAGTFGGGRYRVVELQNDTILHRAGTADSPLGQFFSLEPPTGVLQTRIDKAVLPAWPGGGTSPIDTAFSVKIPAGTKVYVGDVGSQGGHYVGGTQQIVVPKPWTIDGVQVINSSPLK